MIGAGTLFVLNMASGSLRVFKTNMNKFAYLLW